MSLSVSSCHRGSFLPEHILLYGTTVVCLFLIANRFLLGGGRKSPEFIYHGNSIKDDSQKLTTGSNTEIKKDHGSLVPVNTHTSHITAPSCMALKTWKRGKKIIKARIPGSPS